MGSAKASFSTAAKSERGTVKAPWRAAEAATFKPVAKSDPIHPR